MDRKIRIGNKKQRNKRFQILFTWSSYLPMIACQSEKAMAPHSSTFAWKIPWMEEPGRLQTMGSLRVGNFWATSLSVFTFMHWRRKWQPTPVFLPGESQGQQSLVGCRLWGSTELDTTDVTQQQQQQQQQHVSTRDGFRFPLSFCSVSIQISASSTFSTWFLLTKIGKHTHTQENFSSLKGFHS